MRNKRSLESTDGFDYGQPFNTYGRFRFNCLFIPMMYLFGGRFSGIFSGMDERFAENRSGRCRWIFALWWKAQRWITTETALWKGVRIILIPSLVLKCTTQSRKSVLKCYYCSWCKIYLSPSFINTLKINALPQSGLNQLAIWAVFCQAFSCLLKIPLVPSHSNNLAYLSLYMLLDFEKKSDTFAVSFSLRLSFFWRDISRNGCI